MDHSALPIMAAGLFSYLYSPNYKEIEMLEGLFQPMHLLAIFGIALLVLGPKKLPELGKGIGEGIRGFNSAMKEPEETSKKASPHKASPDYAPHAHPDFLLP
jgi:sec-independent protein translocase protein TatA